MYPAKWSDFLGKLDDIGYVIEFVRFIDCFASRRMSHICEAKHWPMVGFACVLASDVQEIKFHIHGE
jgi:hypothetical protein